MGDDAIPLSQLQNEAFETNQGPLGPTSFSGLSHSLNDNPVRSHSSNQRAGAAAAAEPFAGTHGKLFNDPIHGVYRLDPACTLIFDTRQFQRLRRLKQLGMAYYVFPGASHNRFEHSLGVAHLAYRFANQLWQAQPQLEVDRGDIRVVGLAGLCHDLGHGPFSHVFENEFLKQKGVTDWHHEEMSAQMLDYIIDDNAIDAISAEDVTRIKALITAGHAPANGQAGWGAAKWLGEIVANGTNSIDVDKFDYLARDAKYCGMRVACDFNRIMQFSRVIGDEICYKYTEYMNLYELFHARATMHRSVYTHKKAKAIEFMVVDALLEAEPALNLIDNIWDPERFVRLDDGVVDMIENFDVMAPLAASIDEGAHSAILSAQRIIERLRKRQIYKYVTDAPVPQAAIERGHWKPPTPEDVVAHAKGGVAIHAEDVIVQENKIDYSMARSNPLDHVSFYDDLYSTEKRKLRPEQISSLMVASFQEKRLRVYSRNPDPQYVMAVHRAFEGWVRHRFGGAVVTSTPAKPLRQAAKREGEDPNGFSLGGGGIKRARNLFGGGSAGDGRPPRR